MTRLAALILTDGAGGSGDTAHAAPRAVVAGLELTERAVLAAHAAGIDRIHIAGEHLPDERVLQGLRTRGLAIVCTSTRGHNPFEAAPPDSTLVLLPVDTLVEPAAIRALLERASLDVGEGALVVDRRPDARCRLLDVSDGRVRGFLADGNAASTGLALLTAEAVQLVRHAPSVWAAFRRLAQATRLRAVGVDPHFCERLHDPEEAAAIEHRYIRRLNGNEFFFTKVLRRQSVHLTRLLLRTRLSPNHITLLSLFVSFAAAYGFLAGGYWLALVAALLYYLSTLLDCSDGEVARCTFRTSAFGCWLETVSDATSTVLIIGAIFVNVLMRSGRTADSVTAVAGLLAATLVLLVTSYQRWRIARPDPDKYERTLHERLNAGPGLLNRFAVWGSQYIKRACVAHVLLFLALIGQVHLLIYLVAFGASVALLIGTSLHRVIVGTRRAAAVPGRSALTPTNGQRS